MKNIKFIRKKEPLWVRVADQGKREREP